MFTNMKLGKKDPVFDPKTKKLTAPLAISLPTPPSNINWINGVNWPMWKNDQIGCCTQVSVASALRGWSFNTEDEILLDDAEVVQNYSAESGYNPNDPNTDQGGVETEVLKRWCAVGYQTPKGINKLVDFGFINPEDINSVKRAIFVLGGLYIGISVPAYAMSPAQNTWDVEYENTQIVGGHAVYIHGYDDTFLYLNTWGQEWKMTYDFFDAYCDEAYGLVSNEWINKNSTSPLGENINILLQELKTVESAPVYPN